MILGTLFTVLLGFTNHQLQQQCFADIAQVPQRCLQIFQYQPTAAMAFIDQQQQRQTLLVTRVLDKAQRVRRSHLQFVLHCNEQCQPQQISDYFASLQQAILQQRLLQSAPRCDQSPCPDVSQPNAAWLEQGLLKHLQHAKTPDALQRWISARPSAMLLAYDKTQMRVCRVDNNANCVWFDGELRWQAQQLKGQLLMDHTERSRLFAPLGQLISHVVDSTIANYTAEVTQPPCEDGATCRINYQFRWDALAALPRQ